MGIQEKFECRRRQVGAVFLKALAIVLLWMASSSGASAQINSNVGPITLNATLASSLTVIVTPNLVNFTLAYSGISNGSSPITVTTSWSISSFVTRVSLYAYFAAPTTALSDAAGSRIPSANVSGSVNGGGYTAFTRRSPFAATSSIRMFRQAVGAVNSSLTRRDTLNLRINTTGLGLSPGFYTGTLFIQAQAI